MLCSSYYSHNNFQRDIKLTKRIFSFSWYPLTLGLGHNSSTHWLVIVTQTLVYLLIGCERLEVRGSVSCCKSPIHASSL